MFKFQNKLIKLRASRFWLVLANLNRIITLQVNMSDRRCNFQFSLILDVQSLKCCREKLKLFDFLQQFFALADIVAVNIAGMIHAAILPRACNATKKQKLHCERKKKLHVCPQLYGVVVQLQNKQYFKIFFMLNERLSV